LKTALAKLAKLHDYPAPVRILAFLGILVLLWLPLALPLRLSIPNDNLAGILILVVLYAEFIWLVRLWGMRVHRQQSVLWNFGLELSRRSGLELLIGLGIGTASVFVLFGAMLALGWGTFQPPAWEILRVVLEGLLVSLGLGFAEELLFRGWILDELQRDYIPEFALWTNAVLFALVHLRLLTIPALILMGATFVWAKRSRSETRLGWRRDRLALPIGLHAGLIWGNYIWEVGKLIAYTGRAPEWVTGVGRNPLAGLLGILFLGAIAAAMHTYSSRQRPTVRL
jgi:uncharacterized protein